MGTWSWGVFGNDLACDVRDEYRDLLGDGVADDEATRQVLEKFAGEFADTTSERNGVVALAVTQWKVGRLDDELRDRAVAVIDAGADLDMWTDTPGQYRQRQLALARAREQITSSQRSPVRVRKRVRSSTPFVPGDVFTYIHDSGRQFVFWVTKNLPQTDPVESVVELLDIGPDTLPTLDEILLHRPVVRLVRRPTGDTMKPVGFWLWGCQRLPEGRWNLIGNVARPIEREEPDAPNTWVNPPPRQKWLASSSLDRRLDPYVELGAS